MSVSTTEYSAALFAGQVGLFAVVLPYLFFTLLSLVIGSISSLTSNLCLARIDRNLRRMVWKKVVHLPLQFYEANNPKELLSRITTDVTSISTLIMQVLLPVFTTAYSSLLMLGRVSSYDQRLMWALVIVLPVNILISFVLGRMRFGVADLINRRNAQLTAAIAERANNMLLIKSMGTEEKEAAAGEARMRASYQAEVTDLWVRGLALPVNAIASALQSVAIILAGRAFYSAGALDLTQWIAYYGFAIQLTNILSNYCNSWSNFKGAQGSVDRVSQIMDEREEPLDKGREAEAFFREVSARYADSPAVLYEICNEPNGGISWKNNVKPYAERIVKAIRANAPDSIILIGSGTWSQDLQDAAADSVAGTNLMYTCHFYAGTHGEWLRQRILDAQSRGLAVFISEWGVSRADGSGGVFTSESETWLNFLHRNGISWANWSLCDKDETSAALKPGTPVNRAWTDSDLTQAGKFVFSHF